MTTRAYFGSKEHREETKKGFMEKEGLTSAQDEAEWLTDQYLYHAVQSVDARLGEGYARKNPQLVSTMVSLTAEEHQRIRSLDD